MLAEIAIFAYPTCIRRLRRNINDCYGKTSEWRGYSMVKKFWRYIYSFGQNTQTVVYFVQTNKHERDGRTDGHRMTASSIASRSKKNWSNVRSCAVHPSVRTITRHGQDRTPPGDNHHWTLTLTVRCQFRINPVSDPDVCWIVPKCYGFITLPASVISPSECTTNTNKSPKILYFATVREMDKWSGIRIRDRITIKIYSVLPIQWRV